MRARLIAVGERMPAWVADGFAEYRKRLSHELPLELVEIKLGARGKGRDPARAIADEGAAVRAALPKDAHVVALEVKGAAWSSEQLAAELKRWRMEGRDLAFVIGGPDGHAPDILAAAQQRWSQHSVRDCSQAAIWPQSTTRPISTCRYPIRAVITFA